MYRLSKSRLLSGLQCPKRLYLEVHQPTLAHVDAALQARFATGHVVGATARSPFPGGRLIGHHDVRTTMIYCHVLNRGAHGVRSPIDGLSVPKE